MNRALPASLLLHALFIAALLLFGSQVVRQPMPRQRAISVRLAELPSPRPQVQAAPPQPAAEPVVRPTVVPKAAEKKPAPKEAAKPAAKPVVSDPKPAAKPAAPDRQPAQPGPAAAMPRLGADVTVAPQYQYYLDLLEQRIARNWQPRKLGFRSGAPVTCSVHFQVEQDGRLSRPTVTASSGVPLMDREALRAVEAVGTFLPIPAGMAGRGIGITYIFTLTAGN
ncbi:MAG: TonB family protein [Candidatus Latescibacteria bacterium]|nr:TonB family protein [Candidatus Latescibacterota bacterium]